LTSIPHPRYPEPQTWTILKIGASKMRASHLQKQEIRRCRKSV